VWWGAGCSVTAGIPACECIVKEVLRELRQSAPEDYQKLMIELPRDYRRDRITRYVEEAHLNWAHIALAHLICEGYINRVLSTNFDPLIERACGLLGYDRLAVYDLPSTSQDVFCAKDIPEPALIYLHGRHNGFTQVNVLEEAKSNLPKAEAEVSWCEDFAWLIIGYSGTNDELFELIRRQYPFRSERYWAFHGSEESKDLKSILRPNHGGACPIPNAEADQFMVELARQCGGFPPPLFLAHAAHLSRRLDALGKEDETLTKMPAQMRHILSLSRETLAECAGRSTNQVNELLVTAIRLLYDNPAEMLNFARQSDHIALLAANARLADIVASGLDKAGDQWSEKFQESVQAPEEGDDDLPWHFVRYARENYAKAEELCPSLKSRIEVKLSALPQQPV
jgi:hypothetical protein